MPCKGLKYKQMKMHTALIVSSAQLNDVHNLAVHKMTIMASIDCVPSRLLLTESPDSVATVDFAPLRNKVAIRDEPPIQIV